jgi:DNA-directed RNA polymerase specialized sigma24 family protein
MAGTRHAGSDGPGRELTPERLARLLSWLHSDRDQAAAKLADIRHRLTMVLASRGCHDPDEIVDITIDRVARKVHEIASTFEGEPAHFFLAVARNVRRELARRPGVLPLTVVPASWNAPGPDDLREPALACLDRCLARLSPEDRGLLLDYHRGERGDRIRHRETLAHQVDTTLNALRIRIHRLSRGVRDCCVRCLEGRTPA